MSRYFFVFLIYCICSKSFTVQAQKSFGFTFYSNGKDTVRVEKVISESPAEKGGLMANDLLQQMNGISLLNLSFAELSKIFANATDQSSFNLLRKGKPLKVTLTKAYAYTFNRTCLTGNCVNGKGVAIGKLNNNILDGVFQNGELVDGSWYLNGVDLNQKGMLVRRGQLTAAGERFTGVFIDPRIKEGIKWYEVSGHDITKYKFDGGNNFNGVVKCYADPDKKNLLWRGTFQEGQLVDNFYQYDYTNDLEWSYLLNRGMKRSHSLRQLSTGKMLGEELVYDEKTGTWSGLFSLGTSRVAYLNNMSSYRQIEEQYRKATQNSNPSNNTSSSSNYNLPVERTETEASKSARIRLYERIKTIDGAMAPDLSACQKDANYGINVMRMSKACSRVTRYCNDLITLINDYLKNYEKMTPSNHLKDIKDRLSEAYRVKSEIDH